jgi:hypothetical protein
MNFRQLVRTVDTDKYYFAMIATKRLKAQYNPERFHMWKSLHNGPPDKVLDMKYSPHYRFLRGHEEAYWQLQRKFGRNNKWIKQKIKKFRGVYDNILKEGFHENISALETPLVENKYNQGLEIYEGHHRVSIALVLGLDVIPCEVIRRKK